jgi:hypothetical protein
MFLEKPPTSGRAGGLKNREPLKADDKQAPPKGGSPSAARPGVKGAARRNHEAASILWSGRATELRNVDCGMRIEKENHKIRNPQFEIRK